GNLDGISAAARFDSPSGVAVDSAGNVYVADANNDTVRKVTPSGVVTTLAGASDSWGSTDGIGSAAKFASPSSVAVDSAGNIYVADGSNHTIRKITPTGQVSTLAGTAGVRGSADGISEAARFNFNSSNPGGIAVDKTGNVYLADSGNRLIRKISPQGVVTTIAGNTHLVGSVDGIETAVSFDSPSGIAVDAAGNVFVADRGAHTVRKVSPSGFVTTIAGQTGVAGPTDGMGPAARFSYPSGLAIDAEGTLYVADTGGHIIRKVSPAGQVTTLAGTVRNSGAADGTAASFNDPSGVAVDATGKVYVADSGNHTVREITPEGRVTTLAGAAAVWGETNGVGSAARFAAAGAGNVMGYRQIGIALDATGNVYVPSIFSNSIRKVTPTGEVSTWAGPTYDPSDPLYRYWEGSTDGTGPLASFRGPAALAADQAGNLYVADTGNCTVRKLTAKGEVTTLAGEVGWCGETKDGRGTLALFTSPNGIAVDPAGNLYVADANDISASAIRKITPTGQVTTLAGRRDSTGHIVDAAGSPTNFGRLAGIAVDRAGNIYVADQSKHVIHKSTPTGVVTTLAGSAGIRGGADGVGTAATFSYPTSVAVDAAGNVYVSDGNRPSSKIRKITPAGVVSTVAGTTNTHGIALGALPGSLASIGGIAIDTHGVLHVAAEGAILRIQLPQ
ncbi:MAG: hypothetical protein A3G75_09890, partial [Verrucomicrobia bacterium RIFCSPLOWO2_12_FULL_64_8]